MPREATSGWGGARVGAGRPARGPVSSERHTRRPQLAAHQPLQITARVDRAISKLARTRIYAALRRALTVSFARTDFRIVHLAVLPTRLELIIEASDKLALARGMQGFQVSAARWLNRAARRSGTVFLDRYRLRILRTRIDVRDALGRLPRLRQTTWPETWLLRIELAEAAGTSAATPRRWFHASAEDD